MSILGGTYEEHLNHTSLARIYMANHAAMVRLGNVVEYPDVIAARRANSTRWMMELIFTANSAPMEGISNLD